MYAGGRTSGAREEASKAGLWLPGSEVSPGLWSIVQINAGNGAK